MCTHSAVEHATITGDRPTRPADCDVRLRIWLGDIAFDYLAAAAAASNLINDWRRRPWYAIELMRDTIEERLPRLPNERLFLGA
ncbi:hypothetical protein [Nocardia mikamii]|uniref:hypothetical protein n=1 Tax=Nocardia mikamii TaxID=508464 RepID=UPI000A793A95|nr:hypothetical protein [Nocardia mikamii]